MRTLYLDNLQDGTIPGLTKSVGAFLAEAAMICLTTSGHSTGVQLQVSGDFEEDFRLEWTENQDQRLLKNWKDLNEAVEYGATAIALLLIQELTDLTFFSRVPQKGVADYLLSPKNSTLDFDDFNPAAYLEVSGIWNESTGNTLTMRLSSKKRQIENTAGNTYPVFIVVTEFSVPKASIIQI